MDEPQDPLDVIASCSTTPTIANIYQRIKNIGKFIDENSLAMITSFNKIAGVNVQEYFALEPSQEDKELTELIKISYYCNLQVDKCNFHECELVYSEDNPDRVRELEKYHEIKLDWLTFIDLTHKFIVQHVGLFYPEQFPGPIDKFYFLPGFQFGYTCEIDN